MVRIFNVATFLLVKGLIQIQLAENLRILIHAFQVPYGEDYPLRDLPGDPYQEICKPLPQWSLRHSGSK